VTITSDRRRRGPYGLAGGKNGAVGSNTLIAGNESVPLPGKATLTVRPGDIVQLETPGGGGWGEQG